MTNDTVFIVRNVSKRYGDREILKEIDFQVQKGEILGVIGASGAGKSTLLHMLVGFIPSSTGDIFFHAYTPRGIVQCNVLHSQKLVNTQYGFASQQPSFYDQLTVFENLEYFGQMYSLPQEVIVKNAEVLLRLMDLKASAHVLAAHLSGGMKRRLDIACALIHNPPVLILDEPTADLDPVLRAQIWEVIKRINARGTTIVLSSHHLGELDTLCTRIGILKEGKLVELDTPRNLKTKYSRTQEILLETFPGNYDGLIKRLQSHAITNVKREGTYLVIQTERPEHVITQLIGILDRTGESLLDLKLIKPSLDSVFVTIYQKATLHTTHNAAHTSHEHNADGTNANQQDSVSDATLKTIVAQLAQNTKQKVLHPLQPLQHLQPLDREHSLSLPTIAALAKKGKHDGQELKNLKDPKEALSQKTKEQKGKETKPELKKPEQKSQKQRGGA